MRRRAAEMDLLYILSESVRSTVLSIGIILTRKLTSISMFSINMMWRETHGRDLSNWEHRCRYLDVYFLPQRISYSSHLRLNGSQVSPEVRCPPAAARYLHSLAAHWRTVVY